MAAELDLWAPVSKDSLPTPLLEAVEHRDWRAVRQQLALLMDGLTTDGIYGRALLQIALDLPIGMDPVFDSYRAAASIDHGDWDGLRRCMSSSPVALEQLTGMRDVLLAPLDRIDLLQNLNPTYTMLFRSYEYQLAQMTRHFRRWARSMLSFEATEFIWSRPDVPAGRHIRHRRLQDGMMLAVAEVHGGRLPVAIALALEATRLGDDSEPLRLFAPDLEQLIEFAMGDERSVELRCLDNLAKPSGLSPLGAWQMFAHLMPLLALGPPPTLATAARLIEHVAVRLGSPRAQVVALAWRVAAEQLERPGRPSRELPGLQAQSVRAGTGLRVLPQLLNATTSRRPSDFESAEALARKVGNVWAQVASLVWICGINPSLRAARWLRVLLELTGWRRFVLVPPDVAADAALGLSSLGLRSASIVEMASAAGRPNILLDVAIRHIDDTAAPLTARLAGVEALGTLGTSRAGELLARIARRSDDLGRRARLVSERRRRTGLTERELEVLRLAASGLTNRGIAESLTLSQHTIARHLANARAKLGAANRTEAAVMLEDQNLAIQRSS